MRGQPNILWICSDQQRWDTLGCYGNPFVRTPNLDRLAAEAFCFETAICQNPVCTPSRASFLTGRYPRTTRARANGQAIPEGEVLVTKLFRDAGYFCGLHGKLHISPCNPKACDGMERRIDDGYHVFDWSHHPGGDLARDQPGNAYLRWLLDHGQRFATAPVEACRHAQFGMDEPWHQTTWCVDRALSFIAAARAAGRPWFSSVNCFDPHHPFDPPRAFLEPYLQRLDEIPLPVDLDRAEMTTWQRIDRGGAYGGINALAGARLTPREHRLIRAAYWAMCDLLDAQVGRLLKALDDSGQREHTIVIYTSDHGELLGDHGIYLKGPHFFEPAVHVPLLMRVPGMAGRRMGDIVELVDLAPTLCELAGVAPHPGMQGRSLGPLLRGERSAPHRDDAYCEFYNSNFNFEPPPYATMVRTRRHKLAVYHHSGEGELYDLETDPHETRNLWRNPAARDLKADMLLRLCDRMADTVDPLPPRLAPW